MTAKKIEPMLCKHDRAHILAPLLFRSLAPGERKKSKLDVTWDPGDGRTIQFRGFEPLGADDLRVLQALISLATMENMELTPYAESSVGVALRTAMHFDLDAVKDNAVFVETTFGQIARAMGRKDTSHAREIRECMARLANVDIRAKDKRSADPSEHKDRIFRLMSRYNPDMLETGTVKVAMNPLIAAALWGGKGEYILIDMRESRSLDGDTAQILHQILCAIVSPGQRKQFKLETLAGYVWAASDNDATARKRRQRVIAALDELREIGWEIGRAPPYALIPVWIGRPRVDGKSLFFAGVTPDKRAVMDAVEE